MKRILCYILLHEYRSQHFFLPQSSGPDSWQSFCFQSLSMWMRGRQRQGAIEKGKAREECVLSCSYNECKHVMMDDDNFPSKRSKNVTVFP